MRALVVGSLVMDLAFRIPRRPEPGEVVLAEDFTAFRGGKGYNQAVALARLGAEVTMVGAVGRDDHGDGFLEALEREGIDAGRVVQVRGAATAVAVPLIEPGGDVSFVQYQGANRQLSGAHCADLPDCDVLLVQGEVPAVASEQAARVVRGRGCIVLVNPAPVDDITDRLVSYATVVCPNETEAQVLVERGGNEAPDDVAALAEALRTEDRAAVITLAGRGAVYATGSQTSVVQPPEVSAVDATAAGAS
ncbi:MAG: ribokinase, partial [Actinomycetota bacterium]|nr:ribokinase [Actinomycetota bacterium]